MSRTEPTIAQKLRRQSTLSERRMWGVLKTFRDSGFHFRKQAAIGPYVADFVCHHAMVVIEVDGEQHAATSANDEVRDDYMRARGYKVLRIPTIHLIDNQKGVHEAVAALLARVATQKARPNPRTTSPLAGEVAKLAPQARSGAGRGVPQAGAPANVTPSPASLGPEGPSSATLPARGRVEGESID